MKLYLQAVFNHFRALQEWAADKDARVALDVKTFELEVRYRGRYYPMHPLFQGRVHGRQIHTTSLPDDVTGFGGWRPYLALKHPLSTEKLRFKEYLRQRGIATPRSPDGNARDAPIPFDFVVKANVGSFGRNIHGPVRAGQTERVVSARQQPTQAAASDLTFVEAFVPGTIVKIWFWGRRAFFAHAHEFPTINGNGRSTLDVQLRERLAECSLDWASYPDRAVVLECLHFQGFDLATVLAEGRSAWIDFRYAQRYDAIRGTTRDSDNALVAVAARTGDQIRRIGQALGDLLQEAFPAPILVSVDGMIDETDTIQWLEMNTNSVMPPEGYRVMFDDLFA